MKRNRLFFLPIMLALSLSSCGNNPDNPHILLNGDLFSLEEITYENAFREGSFSLLQKMMKSNEPFIFYLSSPECYACYKFQDKITNYISSTHALVLKMDTIYENPETDTYELSEDFKKLSEEYADYFFTGGMYQTPQVYIVQGENVATQVPYSKYSTSNMFSRAMKDYVYIPSTYSFSSLNAYKVFLNENNESLTILIDRDNKDLMDIYLNQIADVIKNASLKNAILELDDTNRDEILSYFELDSLTSPIGIYQKGEIKDSFTFTSDESLNKEFLDKYC